MHRNFAWIQKQDETFLRAVLSQKALSATWIGQMYWL